MNVHKNFTEGVGAAHAWEATAKTILVMGAGELRVPLMEALGEGVTIAAAEGLKDGNEAMDRLNPKLLICALDRESWEIIPLLHNARQHQTPILAVAYSQDAVLPAYSLEWAVDRARQDAVAAIAERLLDDPAFVPDESMHYPSSKTSGVTDEPTVEPDPEKEVLAPARQRPLSSSPPPVKPRSEAAKVTSEPGREKEKKKEKAAPLASQKTASTFPKGSESAFEAIEQLNMKVVAAAVKSVGEKVQSLDLLIHRIDYKRKSGDKELIEQLRTTDERLAEVAAKLEGLVEREEELGQESGQRSQSMAERVGLVESQLVGFGRMLTEAKRLFTEEHDAAEARLDGLDKQVEARVRKSEEYSQAVEDRVGLLESQIGALIRTLNDATQRFNDGHDASKKRLDALDMRVEEQGKESAQGFQTVEERFGQVESRLGGLDQRLDDTKQSVTDVRDAEKGHLEALEERVEALSKVAEDQAKGADARTRSADDRIVVVESRLDTLLQWQEETRQALADGRGVAEKRLEELEGKVESVASAGASTGEQEKIMAQIKDLGLTLVELDDRTDFFEKRLGGVEQMAQNLDADAVRRVDRHLDDIRRAQERLSQRIESLENRPIAPPAAAAPQGGNGQPVRPSGVPFAVPKSSSPPPPAAISKPKS